MPVVPLRAGVLAAAPIRSARTACKRSFRLVDRSHRLVRLDPPFDVAPWDPGYIRATFRACARTADSTAVWVAMALPPCGRVTSPEIFQYLNPIRHGDTDMSKPVSLNRMFGGRPIPPRATKDRRLGWYAGSPLLYRLLVEPIWVWLETDLLGFHPLLPRNGFKFTIATAAPSTTSTQKTRAMKRGTPTGLVDGASQPEDPSGR